MRINISIIRQCTHSTLAGCVLAMLLAATGPSPLLHAQTVAPVCGVNLRLLVIAVDGSEVELSAIRSALDYLGTPYTVYIALQNPNGLKTDRLVQGCRAQYQGVISTTASLGYSPDGGTTWLSALSPQEVQTLQAYEATYGVRHVSWYTFPTPDVGFNWGTALDTSTSSLTVKLTSAGASIFSYLNIGAPVSIGGSRVKTKKLPYVAATTVDALEIQNAWTYLALPSDASTTPLLVDKQGNALMAVRKYADGRENLALTFDSNPNLLHSQLFSYGVINWVTKGLFLGERHVYMSPQVDDLFVDDSRWIPSTACGTPPDVTGASLRITGNDLKVVLAWQWDRQFSPTTQALRLTMAFNGAGVVGSYPKDTLTRAAKKNQAEFFWVNHTFDHENLDKVDAEFTDMELMYNNATAFYMGFKSYTPTNLVTPEVSGLTNQAFLKAAFADGIRYVVSDTSRPGSGNPTPNTGMYNQLEPGIFMIPRRANNLYFNVATPADWVAEYNCLYRSFWKHDLKYDEILDIESQNLLTYMIQGDVDPWMFHQTNLSAYDGTHTLLTDLLDWTLAKYNGYFTLPVLSPSMDAVGRLMQNRMVFNASGATATVSDGFLTLASPIDVLVPVTGLAIAGSEQYGGQSIAHVSLKADVAVTLRLP